MKGRISNKKGVIFVTCLLILLFSQAVFSADYYVSPTGGATRTGTKADPFAYNAIPFSSLLTANHTLYLFGGIYAAKLSIAHNSDYRLTVKPCSASPNPSGCDGLVSIVPPPPENVAVPGTAIFVSGRNVTINGKKSASSNDRNIKITAGNNHGVALASNQTGNIVQYLEITGMDDEAPTCATGPPYCQIYGIDTSLSGAGTEIAYNYLHHNKGVADISACGNASSYGLVKVHHNTIVAGTVNFIAGGNRGVDIYNNTFDATDSLILYDIIHVYRSEGIQYVRIYNNEFINNDTRDIQHIFLEQGTPASPKTEHVRIYNNVFRRGGPSNGSIDVVIGIYTKATTGADDIYIVNNTFSGARMYPIRLFTTAASSPYTNFKVENNIFNGGVAHIILSGEGLQWPSYADAVNNYNIFYHPTNNIFSWMDTDLTTIKAFATVCADACAWTNDHPMYRNNLSGNPLLASATDLTLQSGSPAINRGKDLSAYLDMDSNWPADKNGNPRSGAWDIGAYEYGAVVVTQSYSLSVSKSGTGTITSNPAGISCGSTCTYGFTAGEYVTLTATPASGYTFANWTGACAGTSTTCSVTMNAAKTVTANFAVLPQLPNSYSLTVSKTGTGNGTVSSTPVGISCGATCSTVFSSGASVQLTATSDGSSTFAGWSGACAGTNSCTVAMNDVKTVTATFTANPIVNDRKTLTVVKQGNGNGKVRSVTPSPTQASATPSAETAAIDCGETCSAEFTEGTNVTLLAEVAEGDYTFAGWSGACSGTGECTVTVNDATSVMATFNTVQASVGNPPVSLNVAADGGGGGGCFIATAAFGSYLDPHVMVLREFRDKVLLKNYIGRKFVKLYYRNSPPVANSIAQNETLRTAARIALTPVIFAVAYPSVAAMLLLTLLLILAIVVRRKRQMRPIITTPAVNEYFQATPRRGVVRVR